MITKISTNLNYEKFKDKKFIYQKELQLSLKSFPPGQWCFIIFSNGEKLLSTINANVESGPEVRIIDTKLIFDTEVEYLEYLIVKSINKRNCLLYPRENSKRLVYGESDELPGLIVDEYKNCVLIQINTAGMDLFRSQIKIMISEYLKKDTFLLDHLKYRKLENLPSFESEELPIDISIVENNIKYIIPSSQIQKIGYYFDHRENRQKLSTFLQNIDLKEIRNGLDLFCYTGSWGLNALKANIPHIDFVDQGNFDKTIINNLELNNFKNRGTFHRSDVFNFLDKTNKKYQLIISDPPAFSKSLKNKSNAIIGYQKLFDKIFKVMDKNCIWAIGSCTQGISFDQLIEIVNKRCSKFKKKAQLLDLGVQGYDHPFSSLRDRNFYIKYILYIIRERE